MVVEMEAYDEACERITGKRPAPPDVDFEELTAGFTEAQWAEMERLVTQLYAERGVEAPPFERPEEW